MSRTEFDDPFPTKDEMGARHVEKSYGLDSAFWLRCWLSVPREERLRNLWIPHFQAKTPDDQAIFLAFSQKLPLGIRIFQHSEGGLDRMIRYEQPYKVRMMTVECDRTDEDARIIRGYMRGWLDGSPLPIFDPDEVTT